MNNVYREWTITVTQKIEDNKNKGAWIIDVQAVKGEATKARNFHGIVSQAMLTQAVKGWIDTMEAASAVSDSIDLSEPEVVEPSAPTKAELDQQAWLEDWKSLQSAKKLKDHGVTVLTDTQLTALTTKVKNGFKADYKDVV
jgi:hypothetical protein